MAPTAASVSGVIPTTSFAYGRVTLISGRTVEARCNANLMSMSKPRSGSVRCRGGSSRRRFGKQVGSGQFEPLQSLYGHIGEHFPRLGQCDVSYRPGFGQASVQGPGESRFCQVRIASKVRDGVCEVGIVEGPLHVTFSDQLVELGESAGKARMKRRQTPQGASQHKQPKARMTNAR
jgi:hypothetical protein